MSTNEEENKLGSPRAPQSTNSSCTLGCPRIESASTKKNNYWKRRTVTNLDDVTPPNQATMPSRQAISIPPSQATSTSSSRALSTPPDQASSIPPSQAPRTTPGRTPSTPLGQAPSTPSSQAVSSLSSQAPRPAPRQAASILPSEAPRPAPRQISSTPPSQVPSTPHRQAVSIPPSQAPSTALRQAVSISPSQIPSTPPSQAPRTAPRQTSSIPPSQAPSTALRQAVSTALRQAVSTLPSQVASTPPSQVPSRQNQENPSSDYRPTHLRTHHLRYLQGIVSERRAIRVLSLDGGGIRGLLELYWLKALETATHQKAYNLFDVYVGNSTGSIVAAALNAEFEIDDIIQLYKGPIANQIFQSPCCCLGYILSRVSNLLCGPKYPKEGIETVLYRFFGDRTLADLKKPLLVPALKEENNSTGYSIHWFDTIEAQRSYSENFKVWQAVRASTAAQSFFPPAEIRGEDGRVSVFYDAGLNLNNPSFEAYRMLKQKLPSNANFLLFSFGTGQYFNPERHNHWGSQGAIAIRMPDMVMSPQSERAIRDCQYDLGTNFCRMNTTLTESTHIMDNVSSENLEELRNIAEQEVGINPEFARMVGHIIPLGYIQNSINNYQFLTLAHTSLATLQNLGRNLFLSTHNQGKTIKFLRTIHSHQFLQELKGLELTLGNFGESAYDQRPINYRCLRSVLSALPNLTILKLSGNNGSPDPLTNTLSSSLQRLSSLQQLELTHNNITNSGAELLCNSLSTLTSLKMLSLESNDIGIVNETQSEFMPSLSSLTSLNILNLSHNNFSYRGVERLFFSLKQSNNLNLKELYLLHNLIDEGRKFSPRLPYKYLYGDEDRERCIVCLQLTPEGVIESKSWASRTNVVPSFLRNPLKIFY